MFTLLSLALTVVFGVGVSGQQPSTIQQRQTPDFKVEVLGYIVADFSMRVQNYAELRSRLEVGLPPLTVTEDPRQIRNAEVALARRIRRARAEARQGEIFTPAISAEFRKVLGAAITPNTWAAIMDDNPGDDSHEVNDAYSKTKALSTVPPNILAVLPSLPDDVEYRFVGRDLVLRDARANVILDWITDAIRCARCDESGRVERENLGSSCLAGTPSS